MITIVGSCRDVALAIRREPDLFARRCRGIYLNAGTGTPDPQPDDRLEYNVELDPGTYASLFDVPCPLYWMPCFEWLRPGQGDPAAGQVHGTFYHFAMSEVLPFIAPTVTAIFYLDVRARIGLDLAAFASNPGGPQEADFMGQADP